MNTISRRRVVTGILCGAVCAAGLSLTLGASEAMPFDVRVARRWDDLIEKAQAVVVNPRRPPPRHHRRRRHHRRWRCWWHRGRRVCGWR